MRVVGALVCTIESLADISAVRDRLQITIHSSHRPRNNAETAAMNGVIDRLPVVMEIEAHLRYTGVGMNHL